MKFGMTYDEERALEQTWRRAFAWLPVTMHDGARLWLEPYEYKAHPAYLYGWVYRPVGSEWEWDWPGLARLQERQR